MGLKKTGKSRGGSGTHAHYAGEFGPSQQRGKAPSANKDPAYRASRAQHYAGVAKAASEAHAAAHSTGMKAEAAKHALIVAHAEKRASLHASAAAKLAPGSEHAHIAAAAARAVRTHGEDIKMRSSEKVGADGPVRSKSPLEHDRESLDRAAGTTTRSPEANRLYHETGADYHRQEARRAVSRGDKNSAQTHGKLARFHENELREQAGKSARPAGTRSWSLPGTRRAAAREAADAAITRDMTGEPARPAGDMTHRLSPWEHSNEPSYRAAREAFHAADAATVHANEIHDSKSHLAAAEAHEHALVMNRVIGARAQMKYHAKTAEEHRAVAAKRAAQGDHAMSPEFNNARLATNMAETHTSRASQTDTPGDHTQAAEAHLRAYKAHMDVGNGEHAAVHLDMAKHHENLAKNPNRRGR